MSNLYGVGITYREYSNVPEFLKFWIMSCKKMKRIKVVKSEALSKYRITSNWTFPNKTWHKTWHKKFSLKTVDNKYF